MQVGTLAVQHIFEKNVFHRVPLFQRPYVWNKEDQWQPLWNDIVRQADALLTKQRIRPHFLGASVQALPRVKPGQIETRDLVDGQQRFTTLQILLKAFQDVVFDLNEQKYVEAISALTLNNHPLSKSKDENYKVFPTNADREHFSKTMEAGSPQALCAEYGWDEVVENVFETIPNAYLYFFRTIFDWVSEDETQQRKRIKSLYSAIRERLNLVIIDLDSEEDAQIIFETLNARGTPLLASDLIKNALIQEAVEKKKNVENLYQVHWAEFDNDHRYWQKMIGPGHAQRQRIEIFLQNWLSLRLKSEVRADRVYQIYRQHSDSGKGGNVEERFSSIAKYGNIYRQIDELLVPDSRAKLALSRLSVLEVGTAYPFLLELFAKLNNDVDLAAQCLKVIESFLVRRMVCSLSTRGYNSLFIGLLGTLRGRKDLIPEKLNKKLLSRKNSDATRWPDDEEFLEAWIGNNLYLTLRRDRLRMLLEAMERELRGKKAETLHVTERLHIEHIMPRDWSQSWPLPKSKSNEKGTVEREELIHTIGNLTLLNGSLNSSISNGPWRGKTGKKLAFSQHTVFHLNKKLAEAKIWSESSIKRRSRQLGQMAIRVWPRSSG